AQARGRTALRQRHLDIEGIALASAGGNPRRHEHHGVVLGLDDLAGVFDLLLAELLLEQGAVGTGRRAAGAGADRDEADAAARDGQGVADLANSADGGDVEVAVALDLFGRLPRPWPRIEAACQPKCGDAEQACRHDTQPRPKRTTHGTSPVSVLPRA